MQEQSQENQPEKIFELDESQLSEIRNLAKSKMAVGKWKQKGAYLVCDTGEFEYAVHIGTNTIMIGLDENGLPKLDKLEYG